MPNPTTPSPLVERVKQEMYRLGNRMSSEGADAVLGHQAKAAIKAVLEAQIAWYEALPASESGWLSPAEVMARFAREQGIELGEKVDG